MKHTKVIASFVATAAAAGMLLSAAPAFAAQTADITIELLEAQGFDVRIDRVGSAPLNECIVTDIRNPRETTNFIDDDDDDNPFEVVNRTITVSLDCSR